MTNDSADAREHSKATENDNMKPAANSGEPPRPATEPRGSEGSSQSEETLTDPATGAPK